MVWAVRSQSYQTEDRSVAGTIKDGYSLVTLPRIVTPYRDSVDGTGARVTY
jgi:hypothetical protein